MVEPGGYPHPYAHNLVSSLYAMKGLLESFLLRREEGLGGNGQEGLEKSQEILRRAYGQADEALRIAKRLGEVLAGGDRPREGREIQKVSVGRTWSRLVRLLAQEFDLEGIKILERIPDPFPLIHCHPRDFREILYHLMRNSLQAMQGEGTLVIRAHLSFSTQEEPYATIQVADTGPGIPEPGLGRLFRPFYTTKACKEGNGFGLCLTRELVSRNGGRITVSSFTGFGTTFTLDFPIAH